MKAHRPIPVGEIDAAEFHSRIQKGVDCWPWKGVTDRQGYGVFTHRGKNYQAHRVSWALKNGPIPEGLCACHKCDNPICVNPDHVFLGTQMDNVRDCWSKGRGYKNNWVSGVKNPKAKLNLEKVVEIRKALFSGLKALEVAELFQVTVPTISKISLFQIWRQPGDPPPQTVPSGSRIGEDHPGSVLTDEIVREVRVMLKQGSTQKQITDKFGISKGSVWWIKSGKRWSHVV